MAIPGDEREPKPPGKGDTAKKPAPKPSKKKKGGKKKK